MRKKVRAPLKAYNQHKMSEKQRINHHVKRHKLRALHCQILLFLYRYQLVVFPVNRLQKRFFPAAPDDRHNLHQAVYAINKVIAILGYEVAPYYKPGNKRDVFGYALVPRGFSPICFQYA